MSAAEEIAFTDDPGQRRYEAHYGEEPAGIIVYMRSPDVVALLHTEVEDAYEGRGIGSALARHALDDARAQGRQVLAICPFVDAWITRHPEYEDLRYEPSSKVSD